MRSFTRAHMLASARIASAPRPPHEREVVIVTVAPNSLNPWRRRWPLPMRRRRAVHQETTKAG
jgi:hypothetical protein